MIRRVLKGLRFLLAPLAVWALYLLKAGAWCRVYPAAVVAFVLAAFALSLRSTPLVERFARAMGEKLDDRGRDYCRRVTIAWIVFLTAHLAVTIATVFASAEIWALYNGAIAYILMGLMFAGEMLVRRRVRHG